MQLREKAAAEGVSFEELKENAIAEGTFGGKKKKVLKKKKAGSSADPGIEIKLKNNDGTIATFDPNE